PCTLYLAFFPTPTYWLPQSPSPTQTPVMSYLVSSPRSSPPPRTVPLVLLINAQPSEPASVHWAVIRFVPSLPIPGRYVSGLVAEYPMLGAANVRLNTPSRSVTHTYPLYPYRPSQNSSEPIHVTPNTSDTRRSVSDAALKSHRN